MHFILQVICLTVRQGRSLGQTGGKKNQCRQWLVNEKDSEKKAPRPWRRREEAKHEHPLKSLIHSFLQLGASFQLSQPIPHCHTTTHTHAGLENRWTVTGTSGPDQSTTPIECEREHRERMDDSNAAACHAFHTSSLLIIQSCRAPGGPRHWNPVVQPWLPTLGDWLAATHSSTFSTATG